MKLDAKTIRASTIAHAIRLGQCPEPGDVVGCTMRVEKIEEADFAAGRLQMALGISKAEPYEFVVTREDIAAGKKLINDQEAVYREPKQTRVRIDR